MAIVAQPAEYYYNGNKQLRAEKHFVFAVVGGALVERALIISDSEKDNAFFRALLMETGCKECFTADSEERAHAVMARTDVDICIISAPSQGKEAEKLAQTLADRNTCQIILVMGDKQAGKLSESLDDLGVAVIAHPVSGEAFRAYLKMAQAAQQRIRRLQTEKTRLLKTIEDTKIIDRAKMVLVSYLSMSEQDAHRYIEKQAMDMRMSKRKIAEGILKTYEY